MGAGAIFLNTFLFLARNVFVGMTHPDNQYILLLFPLRALLSGKKKIVHRKEWKVQ